MRTEKKQELPENETGEEEVMWVEDKSRTIQWIESEFSVIHQTCVTFGVEKAIFISNVSICITLAGYSTVF